MMECLIRIETNKKAKKGRNRSYVSGVSGVGTVRPPINNDTRKVERTRETPKVFLGIFLEVVMDINRVDFLIPNVETILVPNNV